MRRRIHEDQRPEWMHRDAILLYTCQLADAVGARDDLSQAPEILAPFPPPLAGDERLLVSGPFRLLNYQALGDGSWQSGSFVLAGRGAVGMGLLAGSVVGNARAKAHVRAQAAAEPPPGG